MTLGGFYSRPSWIRNQIESAVINFVWLRRELKKVLLEVDVVTYPVPHSWRRQCIKDSVQIMRNELLNHSHFHEISI